MEMVLIQLLGASFFIIGLGIFFITHCIFKNQRNKNAKFEMLFENVPIPIFIEDFSAVQKFLASLPITHDIESYLEQHPDVVQTCASQMNILDINTAVVSLLKAPDKAYVLDNIAEFFTETTYETFKQELIAVFYKRKDFSLETRILSYTKEYIDVRLSWSADYKNHCYVFMYFSDITAEKQAHTFLCAEKDILEHKTGSIDLSDSLEQVQQALYTQLAQQYSSIFLINTDTTTFSPVSNFKLSSTYQYIMACVPYELLASKIKKEEGGEKEVVVSDITEELDWQKYSLLIDTYHIKCCWYYPIYSINKEIIGFITIFHKEICYPTENQRILIDKTAHLAAIVIEQHNIEKRYQHVMDTLESTTDLVGTYNISGQLLYLNKAGKELLNIDNNEFLGHLKDYHDPETSALILQEGRDTAIKKGVWQHETNFISKKGEHFPTSQVLLAHYTPTGQLSHFSTIVRNIKSQKQVEHALRESESKFRLLTEMMTSAIFIFNRERILYVNPAMQSISGYSENELYNLTLFQLVTENYCFDFKQAITHFDAYSQCPHYEIEIRTKSGIKRYLDISVRCINFQGEQVLLGSAFDVTTRKKSDEILFYSIQSINKTGKEFAVELVKKIQQTLTVQCCFIGLADDDKLEEACLNYILMTADTIEECVLNSRDTPCEYVVKNKKSFIIKDNVEQKFTKDQLMQRFKSRSYCGVPLIRSQGKSFGVLGIFDDNKLENEVFIQSLLQLLAIRISAELERSENLDFLRKEQALLAQRIKERTQELEYSNTELLKALRTRDSFLANMSHELRTPLNAVLGMCEILKEGVYGEVNSKQNNTLATIQESGQHLLSLISDVLDLSKIEAGNLKINKILVNSHDICLSCVRLVNHLAEKKGITLEIKQNKPFFIQADERYLKQILVNLLSNAIKFTPDYGLITINVSTYNIDNYLFFEVEDTGIGIDEAYLPELFHPFVQLDGSLAREHEGTGLGLALVKHLVHLHGGEIVVKTELNKGSCFTVKLPYDARGVMSQDAIEPLISKLGQLDHKPFPVADLKSKKHILLAEDNESNIILFTDYLTYHHYHVEVVKSGQAVLDYVEHTLPDLILMDIQMPIMNGLTASNYLKNKPETQHIPIIVITALATPEDKKSCFDSGVDMYLSKPVKLKKLIACIKKFLPLN